MGLRTSLHCVSPVRVEAGVADAGLDADEGLDDCPTEFESPVESPGVDGPLGP
jgi:hypothetical protein